MTDRNKPTPSPMLSREALMHEDFLTRISAMAPHLRFLSAADLDLSIRATLDARPDAGNGAWVFAYGSLMWDCPLVASKPRVAMTNDWHRAFCLKNAMGRGSPERPGLTMGLDTGGQCIGMAMHIAEDDLANELGILWKREMPLGGYRPRWIELADVDGGRLGYGLAFTVNEESPQYLGELSFSDVVTMMSTASGRLGSSADYLFATQAGLHTVGVADPLIDELVAAVQQVRRETSL